VFRKLRIQNFKCWADTGEMHLAPITVLFGRNSSGKTSIIRFLLMLKQTVESADRRRVLHLGDSASAADLGTYHDFVHGHDARRDVGFEFEWDLPSRLELHEVEEAGGRTFGGRVLRFAAAVGEANGTGALSVRTMTYVLGPDEGVGTYVTMVEGEDHGRYELSSAPLVMRRRQGRPRQRVAPIKFYGFPEEEVAAHQDAGDLLDLVLSLEQRLRRLHHVGPLGGYPARSYVWSGQAPQEVGAQGADVVAALLGARERAISPGPRRKSVPFHGLIARWLRELGLVHSFEVRPLAEHRREHEVLVRAWGGGPEANLVDVGFGISQALPVIVQCFYAAPGSLVILEQPEIHLHPSAQSGLADLMIEAVRAREGGKDRNVQLLVESHSEHLLERLQRRIAEGALSRDEVAVYFCEQDGAASKMTPLELDLFGNISNWPRGFFGDEMGDVFARADAEARRRQETGA